MNLLYDKCFSLQKNDNKQNFISALYIDKRKIVFFLNQHKIM